MAKYLRHRDSGKVMVAKNASRPKMSQHGGSTWDTRAAVVDGEAANFYVDSTWGRYAYIELGGSWYKVSVLGADYNTAAEDYTEGYPVNWDIVTGHPGLETVPKSELDSFLESVGRTGYSPY